MSREDEQTGLSIKLTKQEKASAQNNQSSPTKRKAKAKWKRTGSRPTRKIQTPRGMSLQTEEAIENATKGATREEIAPSDSDKDENSSSASEDNAPSLKRQNQKRTPPTNTDIRKSLRNRHSTLSTALGNPNPINTISVTSNHKSRQLEIDTPQENSASENYPSLKSLIQEVGFTEKTREYKACVKFVEAISPKSKTM